MVDAMNPSADQGKRIYMAIPLITLRPNFLYGSRTLGLQRQAYGLLCWLTMAGLILMSWSVIFYQFELLSEECGEGFVCLTYIIMSNIVLGSDHVVADAELVMVTAMSLGCFDTVFSRCVPMVVIWDPTLTVGA